MKCQESNIHETKEKLEETPEESYSIVARILSGIKEELTEENLKEPGFVKLILYNLDKAEKELAGLKEVLGDFVEIKTERDVLKTQIQLERENCSHRVGELNRRIKEIKEQQKGKNIFQGILFTLAGTFLGLLPSLPKDQFYLIIFIGLSAIFLLVAVYFLVRTKPESVRA